MPSGLSADDAARIYRLECPDCGGTLMISPLLASDGRGRERIIDETLVCHACRLAWSLKQATEALFER